MTPISISKLALPAHQIAAPCRQRARSSAATRSLRPQRARRSPPKFPWPREQEATLRGVSVRVSLVLEQSGRGALLRLSRQGLISAMWKYFLSVTSGMLCCALSSQRRPGAREQMDEPCCLSCSAMFAILDLHRARGLRGGRFARRAVLSVGQSARKPLPRCLSQASWFAAVPPCQAREQGEGEWEILSRDERKERVFSVGLRVFSTRSPGWPRRRPNPPQHAGAPRCLSQASWFADAPPRQVREQGGGRVGNPPERGAKRKGLLNWLARVFHTLARLAEETTQSSSARGRAALLESGQLVRGCASSPSA